MCKKLCLAVGAVIVGLLVISFTGLSSVLQVKWNETRNWMERQVPPETQLKRLQVEISKIDQDIKRNLDKLAAQQVEADRLQANLNKMKTSQTALRVDIAAMTKALDSKETMVSYNGHKYRQNELAMRLDMKVNDYELRKTEIKTKEQLLASKLQALDLANQRMTEMREQKEKMRVTVAKLEARLENVKLQQVDCPIDVDNSQINKCNVLADKLDRQLAEEEMKTKLYRTYGFDKNRESTVREEKSVDEIKQAAKKALQNDDDNKVEVDNNN